MDGPNVATWFEDHYFDVPRQIIEFLGGDGITLADHVVADIGCGDGLITLGIHDAARPARIVGFDVEPMDPHALAAVAREHGLEEPCPSTFEFRQSTATRLPADDGVFDFAVSWSMFEHVSHPEEMAREIHRILAPHGVAMIQLYPFYDSEHGDHSWDSAPFRHLVTGTDDPAPGSFPLNRINLDELQAAFLAAGLRVTKVELIHHAFQLPPELAARPLSSLSIAGVKLLMARDDGIGATGVATA